MNILFISEVLPLDTYASEVVFYRHFTQLVDEGHKVHIVTDQNSFKNRSKELSTKFNLHIIPNREWYYPPFKPYGLRQFLRFNIYYYLYVKPIIKEHQIDAIFGFVNGNFLLAFTAFVKEKSGLPLLSFFHDDTNELSFHQNQKSISTNTRKILKASKIVLTASDAFADNWREFSTKFSLLYPIPADLHLNGKKTTQVAIGYSGSVYNEIIDVLDQFSGYLSDLEIPFTIIGNNKNASYLAEKYSNVTCLSLFKTAEEANNFLTENCTLCIIPYPEKITTMPWIKTCFPSKFIQYCKLGIPTIVIAPSGSAVGRWCIKHGWLLYLESYDFERIKALISLATHSAAVKEQVAYFQKNVFDSKIIHQKFVAHLAQLS